MSSGVLFITHFICPVTYAVTCIVTEMQNVLKLHRMMSVNKAAHTKLVIAVFNVPMRQENLKRLYTTTLQIYTLLSFDCILPQQPHSVVMQTQVALFCVFVESYTKTGNRYKLHKWLDYSSYKSVIASIVLIASQNIVH